MTKLERKSLFDRLEEGFQAGIAHAEGKQVLRETWVEVVAPPHLRSAEEIGELRLSLGLTKDTMAKILSVSTTTLAAWEKGQRKPPGSVLRLLEILEKVDRPTLGTILAVAPSNVSSRRKVAISS